MSPVILTAWACWDRSGLRLVTFQQLIRDLEATGHCVRHRDQLDRNEKLPDQLAWLREAGFSDVEVVYRNRTFIVTVARKGQAGPKRIR